MDPRIIEYYRLCSMRTDSIISPINNIDHKDLKIAFTSNQVDMYVKQTEHFLTIRENVIGGNNKSTEDAIIIL